MKTWVSKQSIIAVNMSIISKISFRQTKVLFHVELHEDMQGCPAATHPLFALSAGGERVETCQVWGSGPEPWQLTTPAGPVCNAALLTAKIPDQVNPNQRVNMPLMWKFIFLLCSVSCSKGSTCHLACLHITLRLPSVTDYCNEELKSLNTQQPASHCIGCQN